MAEVAAYTQFTPSLERCFSILITTRKSESSDEGIFRLLALGLLWVKTAIEIIQGVTLTIGDLSILQCGSSNSFFCILNFITSPIDAIGYEVSPFAASMVSLGILIAFILFSWLNVSRVKQKTRGGSSQMIPIIYQTVTPLIFLLYGIDHYRYWFSFFTGVLSERRDEMFLAEAIDYVCLVLGIFILISIILISAILSLFIVNPNLKVDMISRSSRSSVELMYNYFRLWLALQYALCLTQDDQRNSFCLTFRAFTIIFGFLTLTAQVIMVPFGLDLENRQRAATIGAVLGCCISGISIDMSENYNAAYHVVSGVLVGAFAYCIASFRSLHMAHLVKIDVNSLSGTYDPQYYQDLLQLLWDDEVHSSPLEDHSSGRFNSDETTGNRKNGLHQKQSLIRVQSDNTVSGDNNVNNKLKATDSPSRWNSSSIQNVENNRNQQNMMNSHSNNARNSNNYINNNKYMNINHRDQYINESKTIVSNPVTPQKYSPQNMLLVTADASSQEIIKPSELNDPNTTVFPVDVASNLMAGARSRLLSYMEGQNFSSIRRAIIFPSDVEILVRSVAKEWPEYSEPQKCLAKTSLTQIFLALMQQPNVSSETYLWFAAFALYLNSDTLSCLRSIKLAAEGSKSWSTLYACYCLQKSAESQRNGDNQRRTRRDGVTDQAAFRRWVTTAQLFHEKALHSLRKFFKSVSSHDLKHRHNTNSTAKKDLKRLGDIAMTAIYEADKAYETLKKRFPQSMKAQQMASMFKLQFFKEEYFANRLKEGSTEGSLSSLGVGMASDTPKGISLNQMKEKVTGAFKYVRLASLTCLIVVAVVMVVFTTVTVLQLNSVNSNMDAFESIANVFAYIPRSCSTARRGLAGLRYIHEQFRNPTVTAIDDWPEVIIAAKDSYKSNLSAGDALDIGCTAILDSQSFLTGCGIVYESGDSGYLERLATGSYQFGTYPLDVQADLSSTAWYKSTKSLYVDGTVAAGENSMMFEQEDGATSSEDVVLLNKLITVPIAYDKEFKGVLFFEADPDDNDWTVQITSNRVADFAELLSEYYQVLVEKVLHDKITEAINMIHNPEYTVGMYQASTINSSGVTVGGLREESVISFVQMMSLIFNALHQYQTEMPFFDYDVLNNLQTTKFLMELCSSENMVQAETIVSVIVDFIKNNLENSTKVVIACACAAIVCVIIAYVFSVRIVRLRLKEFDRDDGSSVTANIFSNLPRIEIKRLYKNIQELKLEFGVIDPDDEGAQRADLFRIVNSVNNKGSLGQNSSLSFSVLSHVGESVNSDQHGHAANKDNNFYSATTSLLQNENQYNNKTSSTFLDEMNVNEVEDLNHANEDESGFYRHREFNRQKRLTNQRVKQNHGNGKHSNVDRVTNNNISNSDRNLYSSQQEEPSSNSTPKHKQRKVSQIVGSTFSAQSHLRQVAGDSDASHLLNPLSDSDDDSANNLEFGGGAEDQNVNEKSYSSKHYSILKTANEASIDEDDNDHTGEENVVLTPGETNMQTARVNNQSISAMKKTTTNDGERILISPPNIKSNLNKGRRLSISNKEAKMEMPSLLHQNYKGFKNVSSNNNDSNSDDEDDSDGKKKNGQRVVIQSQMEIFEIGTVTSSASSRHHFNRSCNGLRGCHRRHLSLTLLIVWFIIGAFNGIFLYIGITALSQFHALYNEINSINESRYNGFLAILYAPDFLYRNDLLYRPEKPLSTVLSRYNTFVENVEDLFSGTVDAPSGATTVGRRYGPRSDLLYQANCLAAADDCSTRDAVYTDEQQLAQGLSRAMIFFVQKGRNLATLYGDGSNTLIDAADPEHWWMYRAYHYDLINGLKELRHTFMNEAADIVSQETGQQWGLLAGALVVVALSGLSIELMLRRQKKQLRHAVNLIRILPGRLLFDYRVFEKNFGIKNDDNDFTFDAQSTMNNKTTLN